REQLASIDREAHTLDCAKALERLANFLDREHRYRHVAPSCRWRHWRSVPTMPCGKMTVMRMSVMPRTACQYGVARTIQSCNVMKTTAPTTGPTSVCTPPISTMASASTDRGMESVSGESEPFEKT